MHHLQRYLTVCLILFCFYNSNAQQANPTQIGTVKGVIRDTTHNYNLKSATVSLFKGDSTLVSYQLSNNYGEFSFKNIALNVKMYLEISHVGYQLLRKNFTIIDGKTALDLKTLIIAVKDNNLQDVEIRVAPITMNGDTLEFNAAAFKLDSNAVVEDLLRKIPNVTLWGDGQITVNGREVKSLLVNGKQFFGGDIKMATQNIAKNALDKVQVYRERNESNPLDSTLTVNLKLKKGKDIGYFGKIGAGYGTTKKYETDASFNMFSPKMQLGIIGASNNINKTANSIRSLTANSTFKGLTTNVEYQPDFRQSGINRPNIGGVTFTYNFIEKPQYDKKSTLDANYFVQNRNNENVSDTRTTTSINATDKIFDTNTSKGNVTSTNQSFNSSLDFVKKNHRLNINQSMSLNNGNSNNDTQRSAFNGQNVLTSTNNTKGQSDFNNKGFNLGIRYGMSPNYITRKEHTFGGLNADYRLSINDNDSQRSNLTSFRSFVNAATNTDYDRRYDTQRKSFNQTLSLELPNLKSLLFGYKNVAGFDLSLKNNLELNNSNDHNLVEDLKAGAYTRNTYLSNNTKTSTVDETPSLTLSKSFHKSLSNRFSKSLNIGISAKQRFIFQDNRSDKAQQNINRTYNRFVPEVDINYTNYQYGESYKSISLTYKTDITIPYLQQLAPLTDSTNLYNLQRGNIKLREAINRSININLNHSDQKSKNTLNYNFSISAGIVDDAIVDSIFIDSQNKRTAYLTNAGGNKYLNANGYLRKALKLKTTELQLSLNGGINIAKNASYLNDVFSFSNILNTNANLSLNYTYKDKFAAEAGQGFNTYRTEQEAFNTKYSGINLTSSLSSIYNITKKFTLSSNISFNSSKSNSAANINFAIWNASAVYRFLKGNNAEFKFSAMDLLHQNTNIINYGGANSFTLGTQNVLQQYFMATFSYYPRQFGKKPVKK
ncbi:TonB-dependent receptor [Pedobacter sp. ISL-68]|uniref:TonB-dependent receptor n=1 Tax=unclassified Pedobacter TaxID=2628915 RepID=UPI001BEA5171|nr:MULTISPECIES: TonB-dependent receptor [unclassified Pedobacter]MBT2562913.1 TonB-dependent receptor [Pedobacter sp. ISL-64]MBT2593530.1 TonB-dependent receptor [Pedobacter sp. ISL-68]